VWEHDSFATGLEADFVFVYLDFPSGEEAKARVPDPERNEELQAKYGIRGFPTVLLMTADGEVFGETGYREGGPEGYVEHVKTLTTSGKKALVAIEELEKAYAAAEDKAAVVQKAVAMLASLEDGAAGAAKLAGLVRKAMELDPENKAGLKLAALKALFDKGQAKESEFALAESMDAKNAEGLYEKALMARMGGVRDDTTANAFVDRLKTFAGLGKIHDKEALQGVFVNAAYWCENMLDRHEDAVMLAKKAKEMGTLEGRVADMVDAILGTTTQP
jgi:hypothetical protein